MRFLSRPFRTVSPKVILLRGVHINFIQEEEQVLEFSAKLLAISDVVIESKQRDIPIPEDSIILERPPF